MMFGFDKTDLQRLVVSALGALTLSATCIGAAVGPARAAAPASTISQIYQPAAQ